ncbi:MAG: imidazole glycerol phosphate synthase subunit HisH [Christensenellaceae bacterium]|jgi:glutamine amidotransferase
MIAIIDYGMGNLRSVQKAFEFLGENAVVTSEKRILKDASHIVLPGVGAISDALTNLDKRGLADEIQKQANSGKPFLGICLGLQLMLDKSYENGEFSCLSLIPGNVVPFRLDKRLFRVPHMGWNSLIAGDNALFSNNDGEQFVYFVHSYHADGVPEECVIGRADYGYSFTCAIRKENMYGLQFHPEKSGDIGLRMLKKFAQLK